MVVATMPVKKGGQKKELNTLKVRKEDAQLVGLLAKHRGLSVEELFTEEDVREFFGELLKIAMRQTEQALGKKAGR